MLEVGLKSMTGNLSTIKEQVTDLSAIATQHSTEIESITAEIDNISIQIDNKIEHIYKQLATLDKVVGQIEETIKLIVEG